MNNRLDQCKYYMLLTRFYIFNSLAEVSQSIKLTKHRCSVVNQVLFPLTFAASAH